MTKYDFLAIAVFIGLVLAIVIKVVFDSANGAMDNNKSGQ